MRYFLTFLLLIGLLAQINAQKSTDKPHHQNRHWLPKGPWAFEPGINATQVFLKTARVRADSLNQNPYLISLRLSKGKWGLHTGIGGAQQSSNMTIAGFRDYDKKTSNTLDFRSGLDYSPNVGKRMRATFGIDYVTRWDKTHQTTDSGYDVLEQITQNVFHGVGVTSGLTYWITPRFGLLAETNVQWLSGYRDSARKFKNFPELDDKLNTEQVSFVRKSILGGIFLMYRF